MKLKLFFALFSLLASVLVHADELTRQAQTELKTKGFYYGEVDGALSAEISSAIKRFQIRNGLEVTGTLTQQSLEALGLLQKVPTLEAPERVEGAPAPPETAPPNVSGPRPIPQQYPGNRPPPEEPLAETEPVSPPGPAGGKYGDIFTGTPFATAPLKVQENTIRSAQALLARRGLYRESLNGRPSPGLEEAILSYQDRSRLPLTGRLDLETLSQMQLLPRRNAPPLKPFYAEPRERPEPLERPATRTLRGIWVE